MFVCSALLLYLQSTCVIIDGNQDSRGEFEPLKNNPHQQPYDGTLKGLFGKHAALIIPYLFLMIRLEATPIETEDEAEEQTQAENKADKQTGTELNVEINRSTLKADLLYRAFYNLKNIILVIELQTKHDPDSQRRLMAYHGSLHLKYEERCLNP